MKDCQKKEEAELFLYYQTNRQPPKITDKIKASIMAEDPKTLEIIEILNKYDLKPLLTKSSSETSRKKGYINNMGCLYRIYDKKGGDRLDEVLKTISLIWKYPDGTFDPESLKIDMFIGMNKFIDAVKKEITYPIHMPKIIKRLKKIPANKILVSGRRNSSIYGKSKDSNIAKAILEEYNYRNSYKLNITF